MKLTVVMESRELVVSVSGFIFPVQLQSRQGRGWERA